MTTDTTPAPIGADAALAQLRHLYDNLANGGVRDTAQAKRIAECLLAPAIAALERAALASAAQPAAVGTIGHVGDGPTTLTSAVAPLLATAAAPKAAPAQTITEQDAHDMGAKGAPATEAERLLFEAWMRGHCWGLGATWNGKEYRSDSEHPGYVDPLAMGTRRLWAAWRDRAALAAAPKAAPAQPCEAYAELPAGIYFAKSVDGKQHNTGKVCIRRERGHPSGWNHFATTACLEDAQAIADAMNTCASRGQAPAGAADPWRDHLADQADMIDCAALQRAMVKHGISFPDGGMEHFRAALGEMVNRFVLHATPTAQAAPAAVAGPSEAPEDWRNQFAEAVYADLEAADNQDVPLEEYPTRILKVLDSIVGPRHPTVIHWRNDAIQACIAIAYKYCRDPESFQYLKQDLQALILAAPTTQAAPAPAPAAVAGPVAWLHDDPQRYDVIHAEVKDLLVKSRDAAGHMHRPLDKSAHYTIPLYAAPAPAAQGDARLWCVHVQGPDDVHAMPSRAAALERANELNECFGRHPYEDGDPIMRAVVIEWPHAADLHVTALYKRAMADAARAAKERGV